MNGWRKGTPLGPTQGTALDVRQDFWGSCLVETRSWLSIVRDTTSTHTRLRPVKGMCEVYSRGWDTNIENELVTIADVALKIWSLGPSAVGRSSERLLQQ
jgi:hypothetical protein